VKAGGAANFAPSKSGEVSYPRAYDIEKLLQTLRAPHTNNNITDAILAKVGRNLHLKEHHPLNIIKSR
jgi:hypothetical protein